MSRIDEEFQSLITKSDNGDVESINILHDYFYDESDMLQNFNDPQVINFYLQGASENKPYSLYQLSMIYMCHEPHLDKKKGMEYLLRSLRANCSQAFFVMAVYHKNGFLSKTESAEERAVKYNYFLEIAIKMNNSNAFLIKAKDTTNDDEKEILLKKSVELENINALSHLGQFYAEKGLYGLAITAYKRGCEKLNSYSFFNLAVLWRDGKGLTKNIFNAIELFEKAAGLGNTKALVCLGSIFHELGDYGKAEQYYLEGITKTEPLACYNMGLMRMQDKEYVEAVKMFIQGARWGDKSSTAKLRSCKLNINSTEEEIIAGLAGSKTHL